ncbi:MAG: DUF4962 domain-containing protein [Phycisphaerae bacterium]|nr:DUF4962 domain-containing protein [Phycisphaerae bacterium]
MAPRDRTTKMLVFAVAMLNLTTLAAESITWQFSDDCAGWKARAKSIVLTRVDATREGSQGSLRIQGRIEEGYNYALSERRPMSPGQLYRLSVWVRVDSVAPGTPMPYLKCEFVAADSRRNPGQVHTDTYSAARLGDWQQLSGEFRAPEGTTQFWLALEKGTPSSAEIDAYLDTIRVESIPHLSLFDTCRLDPMPPLLEKVRGVHPRLYLDAARVAELRQAIQTTHAPMWQELRVLADRAVRRGAPAYRERDNTSGDEQLWQRDVGNTLPVLAMAWVLSGDTQYLDAARQWALASCAYPTWGLGSIDGMDLAAGHQLFGLGLVYDWCYADLGNAARRTIRDTLVRRTSAMFEAAATGKAWWRQSYMQNHLWVNVAGMAVAGLALFDEVDDAVMWVGLPLGKFQRTMAALGSDGASHEGVGYWEYGVEYMLKFMDLARALLGVNLYDHDWWRNTASYAQYLALPRSAWTRRNCIVDIADCPRAHWYGPDTLLRGLAREFHDGHAQWLAQQIDEADVASQGASWLNLVWFDPTIPAAPPLSLPTLHYFDDMDIVSARSDWTGSESLVVFKCGPFIGHEAVQAFDYDPGGGHVHPDAGHFVLFGAGEWLIRDDGYCAKWTGQHNTLLVDSRGQLGEGKQWFQGAPSLAVKARPEILRVASSPTLDQMSGDATQAYARDLGLRRYVRHLLYLKPDALLVCDEVTTDQPRSLELRFHPESRQAARNGNAFVLRGDKSILRLEPLLTAADVKVLAEEVAIEGRQGEPDQTLFTVRLNRHAANWRNVVALSWSDAGSSAPRVTAKAAGDVWTFSMNERVVTFDWTTGMAQPTHQ